MNYFYYPSDRDYKELLEGVNARTFWGENLLLAVVDLDAFAVVPSHSHPHEQGGIVLQGELQFTVAGETRDLMSGDIYIIPSGVDHSVIVGDTPAKILDIFSPVRKEYKY